MHVSADTGLGPPRRQLAGVIATVAGFGLTIGLVAPLLSLILEARGTERLLIGMVTVVMSLGMLAMAPLVPRFIDRFGFRSLMRACLAMECAMILALPAFDSLAAWFVIRFVMGAVAAILFTVSETWLNELTADATRGRVMGIYNTVVSATFGLGPLVIVVSGTEGWRTFAIGASIMVLAAIPLRWTRDPAPAARPSLGFSVWTFARVAPLIAMAVLLVSFKDASLLTLLPVYGVRSGTGEQGAALMLTVAALGGVALQVPIGWLADRISRVAVLTGCAVAGAAGAALLPMLVTAGWPLYVLMFSWTGLFFGVYTVALTLVGERFRGRDLATANAAIGIWWAIGSSAGPLLCGAAMDLYDPHGLPLVLGVVCSLFVLAAANAARAARRLPAVGGPP